MFGNVSTKLNLNLNVENLGTNKHYNDSEKVVMQCSTSHTLCSPKSQISRKNNPQIIKNTLLQSSDNWTEVVTSQPATNLFFYILQICFHSNTVDLYMPMMPHVHRKSVFPLFMQHFLLFLSQYKLISSTLKYLFTQDINLVLQFNI